MKFIDMVTEVLLGLCISILLTITIYHGVSFFYAYDVHQTQNEAFFYAYLIAALLSFIIGPLISINSISMGLIGSGFISIVMAIITSAKQPHVLTFTIFLSLLIVLIYLIILRNRKK